ncbi:hypothetical protein MUA04_02465 [Enterobacteriaceae bacterium H11S18]|uniref:hypothetical protein n=1 Tax=Dryocola clanedunensis TaxID=2925396 RepID=UPI0022F0F57B|nr:hypothetical protein [Dryocola clanedunensis]MCT4709076.1 hypothetical protein [Dryocola clanedunensis]
MKDRFILACQDYFVKQKGKGPVHKRKRHPTLPAEAIAPRFEELGNQIAQCGRSMKPVRVPALNSAEWGHLLRSLELTRAYA